MPRHPGPDDFNCKKCGKVVRYARVSKNQKFRAAFEGPVKGGGYVLHEEEDEEGNPTGGWYAEYIRVADRDPTERNFRQHNCRPPIPPRITHAHHALHPDSPLDR